MKQVRETQVKSKVNMSKTLLDETVGWMYAGGEMMCETDDETWWNMQEKNEKRPLTYWLYLRYVANCNSHSDTSHSDDYYL
jgi:hypothetical protein